MARMIEIIMCLEVEPFVYQAHLYPILTNIPMRLSSYNSVECALSTEAKTLAACLSGANSNGFSGLALDGASL